MNENQTRILIFTTNYLPHIGGAELATKEIIDRLGDSFEVDIITARYSSKMPLKEQIGRARVHRIGLGLGVLDKLILALWGGILGARIHERKKYDIIHSVQASYGGIAAYFFKKKFPEVPFVLNLQEGKELGKQWFAVQYWRPRIIKTADRIVVISKYLKEYIKKQGVDMSKVQLIPNGVDLKKFGKEFSYGELEELRNSLGIKPDDKVVLTSSRLEKKNNIGSLVEAMNHTKKDFGAKLIIIGDGSLRNYLETKAEDNVLFLGTVEHKELPKYMAIANIFVRPSISEGLGTAFIEAMAAGLPIVGTDVGGIPDFLKDFRTGLFCTTEPKSIAEKINLLLGDEELRKNISENARKLITERYQWDAIVEEYKKLYLGL
jgi:glycosyltransferase involved in cell wall biosynthesis